MSFSDAPSYGGSSQSRATNNNKFPSEGPRVMQIRVDFTAPGQSAEIDLTIEQQQKKISQVQGLWINNTDGPNIVLNCEVTNQVVNIAAGAQGYIQLLSQNPPRFKVTSDAVASVDFHFLNFPVIHAMNVPVVIPGNIVRSIVPGLNVTVDDTDPANPIVSATGGGGGGGGGNYYWNTTDPTTVNVDDIEANANMYVLSTKSAIDLAGGADDFSQAGAKITIRSQGGPCAISSRGGSGVFLSGASPAGTLNLALGETVELTYYGMGYWLVVNRYTGAPTLNPAYAMVDADYLPTPFTIDDAYVAGKSRALISYTGAGTALNADASGIGSNRAGFELVVKNLLGSAITINGGIGNIYNTSLTPVDSISVAAGACVTMVFGGFAWTVTTKG